MIYAIRDLIDDLRKIKNKKARLTIGNLVVPARISSEKTNEKTLFFATRQNYSKVAICYKAELHEEETEWMTVKEMLKECQKVIDDYIWTWKNQKSCFVDADKEIFVANPGEPAHWKIVGIDNWCEDFVDLRIAEDRPDNDDFFSM